MSYCDSIHADEADKKRIPQEIISDVQPGLERLPNPKPQSRTRIQIENVIKRSWPQRGWAPNADKIART